MRYIHIVHACVLERYIHSIHAYGFEIIPNILVFNNSWETLIVDSSKDSFENGDDRTYLTVILNIF